MGASIGSICSFLLGRYLFRDCVLRLAAGYRLFRAIDAALQGNGLKIMILLRLSPLIPYNALDYMSGVTAIPLRDYSLACIALLPGALMLCFIGASAPSLAESTSGATGASRAVKIITIVTGVVFGGSGIFAASYYSKKELDRVSDGLGVSCAVPCRCLESGTTLNSLNASLWSFGDLRSWQPNHQLSLQHMMMNMVPMRTNYYQKHLHEWSHSQPKQKKMGHG